MLNSENLRIDESYALPVDRGALSVFLGRTKACFIEDNHLRVLKETEKFYLMFESLFPQICPVIAMGRKGFLFQYVDSGDIELEAGRFDILRSGEGTLITGVKAHEISLVETENSGRSEFTSTKYCFVSVRSLSFHQKTGMEFLIRKFTNEGSA